MNAAAAVVVVVAAAVVVVAADARKPKRIEMVSHISSFPPQSRLHFRNGGFSSNWKRTSWASKTKAKAKQTSDGIEIEVESRC